MAAMIPQLNLFSWNVRGLNSPARQEEVRQLVSNLKHGLIYIQESKLSQITSAMVRNFLGPQYENNFL
jgi:exonuclease III